MFPGMNEYDASLFPYGQLGEWYDQRTQMPLVALTALTRRNRFPMGTGGGVAKKGTDAVCHTRTQYVFEFACMRLHLPPFHLQDINEEPFCQPVSPYDPFGEHPARFQQLHPFTINHDESLFFHLIKEPLAFRITCFSQDVILAPTMLLP
jgi:hypothetical protein